MSALPGACGVDGRQNTQVVARVELLLTCPRGSLLVVFLLSVRGRGWEGGRFLPLLRECAVGHLRSEALLFLLTLGLPAAEESIVQEGCEGSRVFVLRSSSHLTMQSCFSHQRKTPGYLRHKSRRKCEISP